MTRLSIGSAQTAARYDTTIWNLRQLHLFTRLRPREIRALSHLLHEVTYRRGQFLFHMGDKADRLYFLRKGLVKISVLLQSGEERILEVFRTGDTFGELFLMTSSRRMYTAQAMTNVRVYTMTGDAFYSLMRLRPDLSHSFIRHLVRQQRRALLRLEALLALDAGLRLLAILLDLGERLNPDAPGTGALRLVLSQEELARMAGLHRSTVSTLINTYRRQGVLGGGGRSILIHRARAKAALERAGFPLA